MMFESIALLVLATMCAFLMGYSVNQGSTCAVTASKELVHQRKGTMLMGFAVAVGAAGVLCLPLAWVLGDRAHIASDVALSGSLLLGAVLLGVGAYINDACLLGTLARIGQGEIRFLALPVGLTIGFAISDGQPWVKAGLQSANGFAQPTLTGFGTVAGFAILLVSALRLLSREQTPSPFSTWPLHRAMAILGVCGALLFVLTPGWTYAEAVQRSVASGGGMMMIGAGVVVAALAALSGALASGIRARSFHWQTPTVQLLTRSIVGGTIMAFGGTLIPGGNDTLLLSSLPSATLSGVTAFTIMSLTVPLLLVIERRIGQTLLERPKP